MRYVFFDGTGTFKSGREEIGQKKEHQSLGCGRMRWALHTGGAPTARGTFFRLERYERVGISLV